MIPGPFSYHRPATLADAVKLLSTLGDEARPLAGGHSLVPMMKLRLATPEHLVDLHGIDALKGIRREGNRIVIGAMTTQHELLASDEIAKSLPILHETALLIADPQVRYRGTIGGNVANGDPGNDMPALMMTLGCKLPARRGFRRARGRGRRILSGRLFHSPGARRNPDLDFNSRALSRSRLRL
jgi:carbon-monoxide dehydrogenase medium subunit